MPLRIDDQVWDAGRLVGVLHRGRWHRYSAEGWDRSLTPLEPLLSASDARDLEACVLAKPVPRAIDPVREAAGRGIAAIDRLFRPRGLR